MVTLDDIRRAGERISPYIHRTPLIHSHSLSEMTGAEVHLKLENLQKTGSFKVRGAFSRLLDTPETRVVAASMGNHAQAVAFAANKLGKQATIVMPETASIVKQEATRGYKAEVILRGERFSDALDYARSLEGYRFIHPFDDDLVIAGQGTAGFEIAAELEGIDAVVVPVGGGGLISGIATAIKCLSGRTQVIGVQSAAAPSAYLSFKQGAITEQAPVSTIADGIAIGRVGDRPYAHIAQYVDDVMLVGDGDIAQAILLFMERKKLVVEGAGAVTLAALLVAGERFRGKRVVLVLSGGNIDFTLVDRILMKGLVASGRIGVFDVVLDDVPGSLAQVAGLVTAGRAAILNAEYDRFAAGVTVGKVKVVFTLEVRGSGHLEQVVSSLKGRGYDVAERG